MTWHLLCLLTLTSVLCARLLDVPGNRDPIAVRLGIALGGAISSSLQLPNKRNMKTLALMADLCALLLDVRRNRNRSALRTGIALGGATQALSFQLTLSCSARMGSLLVRCWHAKLTSRKSVLIIGRSVRFDAQIYSIS